MDDKLAENFIRLIDDSAANGIPEMHFRFWRRANGAGRVEMTMNEQKDDRVLRFAGLSGDLTGTADHRPPLVLLPGLTFDRSMWNATLAERSRLDPGRRTLAHDLPGHGQSDRADSYGMDVVVDLVHHAIEAAGLTSPVMVGHSLSAIIATIYATKYCASGVVNVDQSLRTDQFSGLLRSIAEQLRGPGVSGHLGWVSFQYAHRTAVA